MEDMEWGLKGKDSAGESEGRGCEMGVVENVWEEREKNSQSFGTDQLLRAILSGANKHGPINGKAARPFHSLPRQPRMCA